MKTIHYALLPLAVCLLIFAGCKKAEPVSSAQQFHGINVDLPKLDTDFAAAAPDVHESLTTVKRYFRYAQFPEALAELEKLSQNASLTEPQKKLVTDLISQTKQVIAAPPAPGQ